MKKTLFFLLLILFLSQYYCQDEEGYVESECWTDDEKVSGKKDCKDRKLGTGEYRCCYVKAKGKDEDGEKRTAEYCMPIDEENYKRIKDYIKDMEKKGKNYDLDIKSMDCNSNYLLISIMSLILLLL